MVLPPSNTIPSRQYQTHTFIGETYVFAFIVQHTLAVKSLRGCKVARGGLRGRYFASPFCTKSPTGKSITIFLWGYSCPSAIYSLCLHKLWEKSVILPQCITFSTYCQDKSFRKGGAGEEPFFKRVSPRPFIFF